MKTTETVSISDYILRELLDGETERNIRRNLIESLSMEISEFFMRRGERIRTREQKLMEVLSGKKKTHKPIRVKFL